MRLLKSIKFWVTVLFVWIMIMTWQNIKNGGLLFFCLNFITGFHESPVVLTEDGYVVGTGAFARNGKYYYQYLGIRYAKPPVDKLRFEPPIELDQCSDETEMCTVNPPPCLQFDILVKGELFGKEDCLYLNIFTHNVSTESNSPVLIFLHGGAFTSGSSAIYGPFYFMESDIVIVTINYRLGILGFASTSDGVFEGNNGLKDQVVALKWVKRNINKFGGNPNKVTIVGESAGSAAVGLHLLSKMSSGVFHKAIMQSGSSLSPWTISINTEEKLKSYAKEVNCSSVNSQSLKSCLHSVKAESLVILQNHLLDPLNGFIDFGPTIEINKTNSFLTDSPKSLLRSGKIVNNVPVMFGLNSNEGLLITAKFDTNNDLEQKVQEDWRVHIPKLLLLKEKDISNYTLTEIYRAYFGESFAVGNSANFREQITKLFSDSHGDMKSKSEPRVREAAKLHAHAGQTTYCYYYDYVSEVQPSAYDVFRWIKLNQAAKNAAFFVNLWFPLIQKVNGSAHADDLFQQWNMEGLSALMAAGDADFSRKFVKAILDFASDNDLIVDGVKWQPISTPRRDNKNSDKPFSCLYFGNKKSEMVDEPYIKRMKVWNNLKLE